MYISITLYLKSEGVKRTLIVFFFATANFSFNLNSLFQRLLFMLSFYFCSTISKIQIFQSMLIYGNSSFIAVYFKFLVTNENICREAFFMLQMVVIIHI